MISWEQVTRERGGVRPSDFGHEEALGAVEGKTCTVTGGAGSLGLASTRALLAEGAKVMLVDLDADRLNFAVRELATDRAAFVPPTLPQTRKYVGDTSHAGARSTCSSATPAMTAR
jgi:NAD(P)-dependent dehydrogenase (short-subunit alcohol dehydrogenase family)